MDVKKKQLTQKNAYSGIYIRSVLIGMISFGVMYVIHITTGSPEFRPECAVNSAFFFALVSPLFMGGRIYLRERRYRIYEEGIGDYVIKVPVSILINKGYLYVGKLDMYLVFATNRPHFISSVKIANVVKVTLYDKDYICLTLKNRNSEERNLYNIKFRIEGDREELMKVFQGIFEGRVEITP